MSKILTKVLVGSRLHGLHNEQSDYDIPECTERFASLQADVTEDWKHAEKMKPDIKWIEEFIYEAYSSNS